MSSKAVPFVIQGVIALVVVIIAVVVAKHYTTNSVVPMQRTRTDSGVLVEVVTVKKQPHTVEITGTGQVQASKTQTLRSEANGRVIWISDNFYPGAKIKKGDVIAKINTDDYAIKLANAKIQLRQREVALFQEEAKGRAASTELDVLQNSMRNTELSEDESSIIRRQPQLQNALADVELAKNTLKQAQLDYDRSIVRAPYDAVVQTASISLGDYVSGSSQLGAIVATDEYWVMLSLNPANVGWLNVGEDLTSLKAQVKYDIGGQTVIREASVKSVQPAVETLGRMVQVLVAVKDPMGEPANQPLLIGSFVHTTIFAPEPLDSIELPRAYVREGNYAYVCSEDNKLNLRPLTTPYRTDNYVYVTDGLMDGERVVTTLISSPVEGRKLRVKGETQPVVEDPYGGSAPGGEGPFGGPGGRPPM